MASTSFDLDLLEQLFDLLRAKGVTEFSGGDVHVRLAGSLTVQSASDGPKPAAEPAKPVDPAVKRMFDRLPKGYDQLFEPKS